MENNRVQWIGGDGGAKEGRLSSEVPITNLKGKGAGLEREGKSVSLQHEERMWMRSQREGGGKTVGILGAHWGGGIRKASWN